jgi:hypothetical protein
MRLSLSIVIVVGILGLHEAYASAPRSHTVLKEFQKTHPCPSTGLTYGKCPGFQKDHRIALICGGPDTVENLQWLSIQDHKIKTRLDIIKCRHKSR